MDPDFILQQMQQLLQASASNPFIAQKLQAYGGTAGLLQQINTYQGQQNMTQSNPFSNAQGASYANTNVIPMMEGNTPLAMAANFGIGMFAEPIAKGWLKDAGRVARPISFAPTNLYDIMRARDLQDKFSRTFSAGKAIDEDRSKQFLGSVQNMMNFDTGDGMFNTLGTIMSDLAVSWMQGGSFSGLNSMVGRGAQLENFGGVTSGQVNDLSKVIQQAGFRKMVKDKNGNQVATAGIDTGFTRGFGIDSIGAGINELQMRGLFRFGTDADVASLAGEFAGDTNKTRILERRDTIEKEVKKKDDEIKAAKEKDTKGPEMDKLTEARDLAQKQIADLKTIEGTSPLERRMILDTAKEEYFRNQLNKGVSIKAAQADTDTLFKQTDDGKLDPANIKKIRDDASERMKKTVGSMLELTEALGGIFETLAGNAPELLRRIDMIDDRALTTTNTSDIAKIVRETNYAGQAAGFNPTQIATIMQAASTEGKKFGLSFQESQEIGRQNMLARAEFGSQGGKGFVGALSNAEFAQQDMDLRTRTLASGVMDDVGRFRHGYRLREAGGEEISNEEKRFYELSLNSPEAAMKMLNNNISNIQQFRSFQLGTREGGRAELARTPKQAADASMRMRIESERRDQASAIAGNLKIDMPNISEDDLTDLSRFITKEAGLEDLSVIAKPELAASRIKTAVGTLERFSAMSDDAFKMETEKILKSAGNDPIAIQGAMAKISQLSNLRTASGGDAIKAIAASQTFSADFQSTNRRILEQTPGWKGILEQRKVFESPRVRKSSAVSEAEATVSNKFSAAGYTSGLKDNFMNMVMNAGLNDTTLMDKFLDVAAPQSIQEMKNQAPELLKALEEGLRKNSQGDSLSANAEAQLAFFEKFNKGDFTVEEWNKMLGRDATEKEKEIVKKVGKEVDTNKESYKSNLRQAQTSMYFENNASSMTPAERENKAEEVRRKFTEDPTDMTNNLSAIEIAMGTIKEIRSGDKDGKLTEKEVRERAEKQLGGGAFKNAVGDALKSEADIKKAASELADVNNKTYGTTADKFKALTESAEKLGISRQTAEATFNASKSKITGEEVMNIARDLHDKDKTKQEEASGKVTSIIKGELRLVNKDGAGTFFELQNTTMTTKGQ